MGIEDPHVRRERFKIERAENFVELNLECSETFGQQPSLDFVRLRAALKKYFLNRIREKLDLEVAVLEKRKVNLGDGVSLARDAAPPRHFRCAADVLPRVPLNLVSCVVPIDVSEKAFHEDLLEFFCVGWRSFVVEKESMTDYKGEAGEEVHSVERKR